MKRCPQCDFIYEDSQASCDMDGRDLIVDEQTLPGTGTPAEKNPAAKTRSKRSPFLWLMAIVWGVVLLAIAYASLDRAITTRIEPALASSIGEQQASTAPIPDTAVPAEPPVSKVDDVTAPENPVRSVKTVAMRAQANARQRSAKTAEPAVATRNPEFVKVAQPVARRESVAAKPVRDHSSKDSKLTSLFKKTRNILTKPFKR